MRKSYWLDGIKNGLFRTRTRSRRRWQSVNHASCIVETLETRVMLSATPGVEVLVNTTTEGIQRTHTQGGRSIDAAADDSYVVVWSSTVGDGSGKGIFAQRFDSSGAPIGGEIAVNTTTSDDQMSAAVAVRDDGSFVVTWQSRLQDGSGFGVYAQQFDASGAHVGGEIAVNTTTLGNQQLPSIAILDGGGFAVAWTGRGTGDANGVYARIFDSSGAAVTGEIAVNTTKDYAQVYPSIAADDSGGFAVVWQGNGGNDRKNVMFRHFDSTGAALSAEVVVNETTAGIQKTPSIALTTGGDFVVAWSGNGTGDDDGIFARRLDGSGAPLGSEILINSVIAGKQTTPSITALAGDGFAVTWAHQITGTNFDIAYREFDGSDTPLAADVIVNSTSPGRQWNPTVTSTSTGTRIAWSGRGVGDSFGVFDPVFGSSAVANSPELVNTTVSGVQRTHTDGGRSVATAADGSYVVTWSSLLGDSSGWGVYFQRYAADGTPLGGETLVNTTTSDDQNNAAVAVQPDGSFVITWQSELQDGSGWGIFAQLYDSDGNRVGSEFAVNTTTSGNQQLPAVAVLAGGNIAIAWTGNGPGDANGAFARIFDSSGTALTGEIPVNTTTEFNQTYVAIAPDASGGFAVVWHGNGGGDRKNVLFRSFDGTGTPTSGELVVTETTAGIQRNPSITFSDSGHYIVAWAGNGIGDGDGIFARRIGVTGTPLGGEIMVNKNEPHKQTTPSIIATAGGGFAVVWAEVKAEDKGTLWYQEFDDDDDKVGKEVQIDPGTGRQWSPSIATLGDDQIVVWSGPGDGDAFGVFQEILS